MTRSAVRAIACDKLAQWEYEARVGAQGLKATVEAHAFELMTCGVDLPDDATPGDRAQAMQEAWARVDEGRTRADALRLVSRVLRRVLAVLGGEPIYDRDAPPETVRQARVGMFVEKQEERTKVSGAQAPAHAPGDLTKAWLVQHADGLTRVEDSGAAK